MLYVTTRSERDVFTAQKALRENRGPDGGFYVPFRMPKFSGETLDAMAKAPFHQRIAEVLNCLFQTRLTVWDVEFAVGRNAIQLHSLGSRIRVGECWHNPDGSYARLGRNLGMLLTGMDGPFGNWMQIAIGVAVLGSLSLDIWRSGVTCVDLAVASGDFLLPVSGWYAREWGFPIGRIVICCQEQQNLWDLLSHGRMRTDSLGASAESIPVPPDLERLLYACGGRGEVAQFLDASRKGCVYCPGDGTLRNLRQGLAAGVVSCQRIRQTIPAVYRTHGYLMSGNTALAYAGVLDYRARTGETGTALILAENSPVLESGQIAPLVGLTEQEIKDSL